MQVLRNCGLLKFFLMPLLQAKLNLLEFLIRLWNLIEGKFIIQGQEVGFDSTDIYFLTILSQRGERPHMGGVRVIGESLDMLIARACLGAHKSPTSRKLQIPTVNDLSLCVFIVYDHEGSKLSSSTRGN